MAELDIIIPVYFEGRNILRVLTALRERVKTPFRVLICYDTDEDDTLAAIRALPPGQMEIECVKNPGRGPHGAVCAGFRAGRAPAALVVPADDDYNAGILDGMHKKFQEGSDLVCASRFMPGGSMQGCPWLKYLLVRTAAWTLHVLAGLPTRDPTNGFRLFSRRLLDRVVIESSQGFTYSLELLVKCHRLGWNVAEVPAQWRERSQGQSRFRVFRWLAPYLRWYGYAFATTWFRRPPDTVPLRPAS